MTTENMMILLHAGECPYDYQCGDVDCMECMNIHMEKGGAEDGNL